MYGSVLVVDDDADLLEGISEFLNYRGFEVKTARNGLEAVSIYEDFEPDLVLLDISMPKYDGIFTLKAIQAINLTAKVVLLTGNYNSSIKQKTDRFDIIDVIEKPCSLKQLESVLKLIHQTIEIPI
ncbi:response regulator [Nitrosopumilus sp.]|uniref:response regulator n=1 Tax=Nitrosopumilus sp. TaxID=2024843 RepID=UPI0026062918|nr:response regulator [Nitrosopumilus sp.]